jgi:HSP90 family molecular chaperone
MMAKKTLEINPHHSAMKKMLEQVKDSVDGNMEPATEDLASVMWHMALLNSGFNIDEPSTLTDPLQKLINVGFGLDRNEPVTEIEVEVEEDEPPKSEEK